TACAVTSKDFLLSAPVPVGAGQCYRLSVHQKTGSSKLGTLLIQLDWKGKDKQDLHLPTAARAKARSAQRWRDLNMTVRAPTGSKYAVVRARAASGKIWVDDFSLKKIPDDCEAELFV